MKKLLKKIIYKFLIGFEEKLGDARVFYNLKKVSLGKESILYREAQICNMRDDPKNILIGDNSHIRGELLTFNYGGNIKIGNNTFVGIGTKIWSGESVKIGSNVLISHNVNILDTDSHELNHIERAKGFMNLIGEGHPKEKGNIITEPVIIEDNVWISFNAVILKGVKIGRGAIIAAGAIVTKDVEAFTLVAGNPAKEVKRLD
jgi:acetyltransferase-like isoleucine patch superfamily enzyme